MHNPIVYAASLLTLTSTVLAAGSAHVISNCGFPVYYASVAQNAHAEMQQLPAEGYSEQYNKPNVGVSIKLATTLGGQITQFEFTWDGGNIYYDMSNINGNPFAQYGMSLVPSSLGASGYPTCVAVNCPAGQDRCEAAYNNPDDVRTTVCPDSSDLTLTLCSGGSSNVGGNPAPAESSSAKESQPAYSSWLPNVSVSVPLVTASPKPGNEPSSPAIPDTPAPTITPAPSQPAASATKDGWGRHHWTQRHVHRAEKFHQFRK